MDDAPALPERESPGEADGPAPTEGSLSGDRVLGEPGARLNAVEIVGLVVAPVAVLILMGAQRFYIQNGVDPFIYAGYTFDAPDLVERYGYPYYAVRFGLLVPSEAFQQVFGVVGGYYLLRWCLAVAGAGALYVLFRRLWGPLAGALAALLFLTNPIVVHALMTVYSDTVSVTYVCVATVCLVYPTGDQRWRLVLAATAGVLLGLALNANLFLVAPLAAAGLAWLAVSVRQRGWRVLAEGGALVAGVLAVTLLGALYQQLRFGDGNILSPSIEAARSLSATASTDRAPTARWVHFRPYVLLPGFSILLLLGLRLVAGVRLARHEMLAVALLAAMYLVHVVHQFVFQGYSLETYFYTSYLFGPTVVVLMMAMLRVARQSPEPQYTLAAGLASTILLPYLWWLAGRSLSVWSLPAYTALFVAIVGFSIVSSRWRWWWASCVGGGMLAVTPLLVTLAIPRDVPFDPGQTYRREPNYQDALFNPDTSFVDTYQVAQEFMAAVPNWKDAPGSAVLWYDNGDVLANLVASTFLWQYPAVQAKSGVGLPELDEGDEVHLRDRTPRYLVLLSSDPADVDAGLRTIEGTGLPVRSTTRSSLERGGSRLAVAVLELTPASCDQDFRGRLEVWVLLPTCPTG